MRARLLVNNRISKGAGSESYPLPAPLFVCQRRNLYVTLFAKRFAEKLR